MLMRMSVQIEPRPVSAPGHGGDGRDLRGQAADPTRCALAVGGLDPGGGAGVLADVRAFARAGAFGCAAVALTTVQSTAGLRSVHAQPARLLMAQIREVLDHQNVRAIKIGALGSLENVRALARELRRRPNIPIVLDTPMRPTRGRAQLLGRRAFSELREEILPLAALATVNIDEVF